MLRKLVSLAAIGVAAAVLSGCNGELTYKGSYFSSFGPASLKAKATGTSVGQDVIFQGRTVRGIEVAAHPVPTDAAGNVCVNVNWAPNVYEVAATTGEVFDSVVTSNGLAGASEPAVLTIVGPFAKGVFAGGLLKTDQYLNGLLVRKTAYARTISFGIQHPLVTPVNGTVAPAFLLIDNDNPVDPIAIAAVTFNAIPVFDNGVLQKVEFQGNCYFSEDGDDPELLPFALRITNSGGGYWTTSLVVIEKGGSLTKTDGTEQSYLDELAQTGKILYLDQIKYFIPPTGISNGKLIIRVP